MRKKIIFDEREDGQGRQWITFCSRFIWVLMIGISAFLASRSL